MTHKDVLKLLTENHIPFVVIGGTALRIYNSPRVTHDIDLSIQVLSIDKAVVLMFRIGYFLVTAVDDSSCSLLLTPEDAVVWIEQEKVGAVSFVQLKASPGDGKVPLNDIDISSQVDFVFEPGIPFPVLEKNALTVELEDFSFLVASPGDLLYMKENRPDKTGADEDDIRYLRGIIGGGTK